MNFSCDGPHRPQSTAKSVLSGVDHPVWNTVMRIGGESTCCRISDSDERGGGRLGGRLGWRAQVVCYEMEVTPTD